MKPSVSSGVLNAAAVTTTLFVIALVAAILFEGAGLVAGKNNPRTRAGLVVGTPQPASSPADPFDGELPDVNTKLEDPLDGDLPSPTSRAKGAGAPAKQTELAFVRSGRPAEAASSVAAYDDDLATIWQPGAEVKDPWLWLDLGEDREVREVRWLAIGTGSIEVALSSDRRLWHTVEVANNRGEWQGIELSEEARYIRLALQPGASGRVPGVAEVRAYGAEPNRQVSQEQKAKQAGGKAKRNGGDRKNSVDGPSKQGKGNSSAKNAGKGDAKAKGNGPVSASATRGETRCDGARERCRTREGTVNIEEDCGSDGSCVIDVRADAGSATCDAGGGSKVDAGDGRKGGEGGACDAAANGGTVAIGDVNP